MAKAGFRVLDSDIHIIEPPDLGDRYLDAPFKGRVRGFGGWVLDLRIEIDVAVVYPTRGLFAQGIDGMAISSASIPSSWAFASHPRS